MTPADLEDSSPGKAAGTCSGEIDCVAPCDNTPAYCGSFPASDDEVSIPEEDSAVPGNDAPTSDEDTPVPGDDAPGIVDGLYSSRRLLAFCCSLSCVCTP